MGVIGRKNILLPKSVDMEKWAVVACDQFTSQPEYWDELAKFVGDAPSTLKLTLPEIYLKSADVQSRMQTINSQMREYYENGLFKEYDGFVLVERLVEDGKKRIGIVLSIDLEAYDYRRISTPIRATEDTILDRLPPRIAIRKDAIMEFPHILLLADDREKRIIESLYEKRETYEKLYDFSLNMGGGNIKGYFIPYDENIVNDFYSLLSETEQVKKYGENAGLLFAVGDGNHSLAVAKKLWEERKKSLSEEEKANDNARYALVEVNNLYEDALTLEPIHRVIKNVDHRFIADLSDALAGDGRLKLVENGAETYIRCPEKASDAIRAVQSFIERYDRPLDVDYVHGENHLRTVVKETGGLGIVLPVFEKEDLFDYVVNVGNLPKKAFSIGGAEYKKYYLEGKLIK